MPDTHNVPQSAANCNDLDTLTFPPPGDLDGATVPSLLLHALTGGEGDPLEEMLAAVGRRVDGLVAQAACPEGVTSSELYGVSRTLSACAEIRRRQVDRVGGAK